MARRIGKNERWKRVEMKYKLKKIPINKAHFVNELYDAFKNRPDLYSNAFLELQQEYQAKGRILFFELANKDYNTLRLLFAYIFTQDDGYFRDRKGIG